MGTFCLTRTTLLAASVLAFQFRVSAQGSLTPPGAPAATMKSLDQVEARTAITNASSLVTISQPGSYYLTQNLTVPTGDGIDINANQVTLNLNGFTISSTAASATGSAIYLNKATGNIDVTILNGHITSGTTNNNGVFSGPGFLNGIYFNVGGFNLRAEGVSVYGCLGNGIYFGQNNSSVVNSCTVTLAGSIGIYADTVTRSTATTCGFRGILANAVSDCRADEVKASGYGISSGTANNCTGNSTGVGAFGISTTAANNCTANNYGASGTALHATSANNCTAGNLGDGGTALSASVANNCFANDASSATGGTGLNATIAVNCYATSFAGTGLKANIATACFVSGITNITHKYNMP